MTKQEVVLEVTRRLGDPSGSIFGDRVWGYFIETLYEMTPNLSETEIMAFTKRYDGRATTNTSGRALVYPTGQNNWGTIVAVMIAGYNPARRIDVKEYEMMRKNRFYMPSEGEYFYYISGSEIHLLTGIIAREIIYAIYYLADMDELVSGVADSGSIDVPNSVARKAIPIVTTKMKQELGMIL